MVGIYFQMKTMSACRQVEFRFCIYFINSIFIFIYISKWIIVLCGNELYTLKNKFYGKNGCSDITHSMHLFWLKWNIYWMKLLFVSVAQLLIVNSDIPLTTSAQLGETLIVLRKFTDVGNYLRLSQEWIMAYGTFGNTYLDICQFTPLRGCFYSEDGESSFAEYPKEILVLVMSP